MREICKSGSTRGSTGTGASPPLLSTLPPLRFTPLASRWRETGWKPVFHDRLEAYPPLPLPQLLPHGVPHAQGLQLPLAAAVERALG